MGLPSTNRQRQPWQSKKFMTPYCSKREVLTTLGIRTSFVNILSLLAWSLGLSWREKLGRKLGFILNWKRGRIDIGMLTEVMLSNCVVQSKYAYIYRLHETTTFYQEIVWTGRVAKQDCCYACEGISECLEMSWPTNKLKAPYACDRQSILSFTLDVASSPRAMCIIGWRRPLSNTRDSTVFP